MIKRARNRAALGIAVVLTLAAAGCAGQVISAEPADAPSAPAADQPSPGPARVHPRWRSCAGEPTMRAFDAADETPTDLRLSDSFRPVAARLCRESLQRRPDGGTDAVAIEESTSEVTALYAALRLPDESPVDICTTEGYVAPRLALLDAQGRWVRPGIPVNGCSKPRAEFLAAVKNLRWQHVTSRVLQEVESAAAAASGCDQTFTDMVWFEGTYRQPRRGDLAPLAGDNAAVRLCVYRVAASEQGSEKPAGDFVSGGPLPAGRWAAVKREIRAAGSPAACTTPANRFARLVTPRGEIYVELDGCRRIVAPTGVPGDDTPYDPLWQGSSALPALLTGP